MDWFRSLATSSRALLATSFFGVGLLLYTYKKWTGGGRFDKFVDLTGKVVIVTGANCGIGFETAKRLYSYHAHVILACRNQKEAEKAQRQIAEAVPSSKGQLEVMHLDLSNYISIRNFVENFRRKNISWNILVNNAGLINADERRTTSEGWELTLQTNHLGPFYLTNLLLALNEEVAAAAPKLTEEELQKKNILQLLEEKRKNRTRVVLVASLASERPQAKVDWADLDFRTRPYSGWTCYRQSKLCNVLFARELAAREAEKEKGALVFSLHPGLVASNFGRGMPIAQAILSLFSYFPLSLLSPAKNNEQGAQTTLYCCCEDEEKMALLSGAYFADCRIKPNVNSNEEDAKRLWDVSQNIISQRVKSVEK